MLTESTYHLYGYILFVASRSFFVSSIAYPYQSELGLIEATLVLNYGTIIKFE